MKVLMISADANIIIVGEPVQARILAYGDLIEKLNVIILAGKYQKKIFTLSPKVEVVIVGQAKKILSIFRAYLVGRKLSVDLITCQDPFFTGLVGVLLKKKLKRAKLEIQIHTALFSKEFLAFSYLNRLKSRLARYILQEADSIRVVSERLKTDLLASDIVLKSDPVVLPIFVDSEKLKNAQPNFDLHHRYPSFKKIILMVARLAPEKNFPLALAVVAEVIKSCPTCGLVIVGDGPERKNILLLARRLGIADQVSFEGWKNDLVSYYKSADVFLQTSKFEGYGLSLVEALACGLPVVSTPVGIMNNNIGQIGCSLFELSQAILNSFGIEKTSVKLDKILKFKTFQSYAKAIVLSWSKIK
ncbi:MAG: glycosyltransferase [Patescibacteria group bacterium]